jgi:hypothetical protein
MTSTEHVRRIASDLGLHPAQVEDVLRRAGEQLRAEIADEVTAISAETLLEAEAASTARIAGLERLAQDILATFTDRDARRGELLTRSAWVDAVQVQAWRATLAGAE